MACVGWQIVNINVVRTVHGRANAPREQSKILSRRFVLFPSHDQDVLAKCPLGSKSSGRHLLPLGKSRQTWICPSSKNAKEKTPPCCSIPIESHCAVSAMSRSLLYWDGTSMRNLIGPSMRVMQSPSLWSGFPNRKKRSVKVGQCR